MLSCGINVFVQFISLKAMDFYHVLIGLKAVGFYHVLLGLLTKKFTMIIDKFLYSPKFHKNQVFIHYNLYPGLKTTVLTPSFTHVNQQTSWVIMMGASLGRCSTRSKIPAFKKPQIKYEGWENTHWTNK